MINFTVSENEVGIRLDVVLAARLGISRSQAAARIKSGLVTVGDAKAKPSHILETNETVVAGEPKSVQKPATLELPIVYEDDDLIIVNKPAGILVHPGAGRTGEATVADFARPRVQDDDALRPGIVHRLDRETSGLLVIAKHPAAKKYMQGLFESRGIHKTYLVLVAGHPNPPAAKIDLPLDRSLLQRVRRGVRLGGRPAVTVYHTLNNFHGFSLVEAEPLTGRTHQIRAHLAAIGHPVAGDHMYGAPDGPGKLSRQFLHAARLKFVGPSGKKVEVESPLPPDLSGVLDKLSQEVY
jgi:23S rRNA pseudouridine1911/1915/1917 synthase